MLFRYLVIMLALMSGGIAHAAAPKLPQVQVPPALFHASWNNRLPTSGGELLGLIGGDLTTRIAGPTLVVGGIDNRDVTICVSIRQISGAYSANFTMRNPRVGPKVAFLLPRQKISAEQLSAAELSILVRASSAESCARDSDVLPAAWNNLDSNALFALVNNHQADRTRTMAPRGMSDCERLGTILPGRALRSYQMACRIVLPPKSCMRAPLAIELQNAGEVSFIRASIRPDCP